jgi:hypothetical protein
MNYRKTNTIQKVAMERRGFLGTLILFFLVISCTGNSHTGTDGGRGHAIPIDPNQRENSIAKNDFMTNSVGYFRDCGKNCLEKQIIVDAQANKDANGEVLTKKDSYKTTDTAYLPKKKGEHKYFEQIARQNVVGDEERHKDAKKSKVKSGSLRIDDGIQGSMKDVFDTFLSSKNANTAKHPRFFVVASYMDLSEKSRRSLLGAAKDDKAELIKQLRTHLEEFEAEVSKVRKGGEGVEMIIPVTAEGVIEYKKPKKDTFITTVKRGHRKHYTLDETLDKKLGEVISKVKAGIDELENKLK